MSLIAGFLFIFFGFILKRCPPENINDLHGYRSPIAMKNKDTWNVAQRLGGQTMIVLGLINVIFGAFALIVPLKINNETIQLLFLVLGSAVMTIFDELTLRKIFYRDGSRKIKDKI
ncbi:SdpI family protein [Clostridium sardiniense]|uniref:SdpI family protein n=1 Tax=Clostridium sardiniense TaxID=29369 RepID=UPI003D33D2E3